MPISVCSSAQNEKTAGSCACGCLLQLIKPALQLADLALQILDLCIVILDLSGQRCVQRIVVALRIIHGLLCLLRFLPQLAPLRVQLIELAFQFASGLFIRCRIIGILNRCDLIAERAQTGLVVAVFVCGARLIVSRLCLRELRIRIIDPALIWPLISAISRLLFVLGVVVSLF